MPVTYIFRPVLCSLRSGLACRVAAAIVWLMTGSSVSLAHEVWIAPHNPSPELGSNITADLRIGDNFVGNHLLYIPQQTRRVAFLGTSGITEIVPRVGSSPVIDFPAELLDGATGHAMLIYESADSYISYRDQGKFFRFTAKKGAAGVQSEHEERGLAESGFVERYSRYAKSSILIGRQDAAIRGGINDRAVGMEVEFVVKALSVLDDASQDLTVQLLYQGAPLPDARVSLFKRAPDGEVSNINFLSGPDGLIEVAALPEHEYLLDHVTLRALDPQTDKNKAVWESLWASLTFSGVRGGR